jgi:chromosome segregation ATPase
LRAELEAKESDLKLRQKKASQAETERNRANAELERELGEQRANLDQREREFKSFVESLGIEKKRMEILDRELRERREEIAQRELAVENNTSAFRELQRQIGEKTAAIEEQQKSVQELAFAKNREIEELRTELAKLSERLQAVLTEHSESSIAKEREVAAVKAESEERIVALGSEVEKLREECGRLGFESGELKSANARLVAEIEQQQIQCRELAKAKTDGERLEGVLRDLRAENAGQKSEIEQLSGKLRATQGKLAKARKRPKPPVQNGSALDAVHLSYLQKVLLQFFLQDGNTRETLIPMILSIVGCDEAHIQAAVRQWTESHQLINQSFWNFG